MGDRYRVKGPHRVLGFPPGAVIDDPPLTPARLDRMVTRGSLEPFPQAHAVTRVDQTRPTTDDAAEAEE